MEDEIDKYYKNMDPLHPDNFRSRSERATRMKYPENNQYRIIIPSNKGGYGFNAKNVNPAQFPGLNRLILKQTAEEATKVCEKTFAKKKKEEVKDRHWLSYLALQLALIMCIVGFCVFMIPIYLPAYQNQNVIYIGFLCLAAATVITMLVIFRTLLMKRKREGLEETTIKALKEFIQQENEKVYNKLNLELHIGYRFFWLEVRRSLR